jgi:NAD(P)-dependent dehydrogenase (short-subunit alcohol dehydrogenase family)
MSLANQVALITGAASGIGRATALLFAKSGAKVALVDQDAEGLGRVAKEIGGAAKTYPTDLSDSAALAPLVQTVQSAFGRIDILVNCAGVSAAPHSAVDFTDDKFEFVIAINLRAPFILTREVGKHMIERGGGGRIVNISSSAAFRATGAPAIYAASKAGINALTRTAAADLGPHGINVNAVAPGLTRTGIVSGAAPYLEQMVKDGPLANLMQRVAEPEDVAEVIQFLCLPASKQMTGQVVHTSAGLVV